MSTNAKTRRAALLDHGNPLLSKEAALNTVTSPLDCSVADCTLHGTPIKLSDWATMPSQRLAEVVGVQQPGGSPEYASDYNWQFVRLPVECLVHANEDGEAPAGGWSANYLRHLQDDHRAVSNGSTEYAGRDAWIKDCWARQTDIYPLFVVSEAAGEYRLWDGYRRLSGAFHYGLDTVFVLLGRPK